MSRALAAALVLVVVGCSSPRVVQLPTPRPERPTTNLPHQLRQRNWVRWGEGSCVHASSIAGFNWANEYKLASYWRRKYGGGETATSIVNKYRSERIPVRFTRTGDPSVLHFAHNSRRGAVVFFFTSHAVWFCGFETDPRIGQVAVLLDNNRTDQFLRIPYQQFLRRWKGYGGFALVPLLDPSPPIPSPAYIPRA